MKTLVYLIVPLFLFGCSQSNDTKIIPPVLSIGINYTIIKKDLDGDRNIDIEIPSTLVTKDQMIKIACLLKRDMAGEARDNFVVFFRIQGSDGIGAWASVSYLPRCNNCSNTKDPDGNSIEYYFIGMK